jgi:O-antigen/teichoic acid export membrane protein
MSLSVVAFAISQILMSTLQRFFAFKKIVIGETFSGCILLVTTAYLAITGYGVWSLVIGQLVAGTTRAIVFAVLVLDPARLLPKHDQSELSTVKTFAAYQTGERLLNYLGWNLDKLIIGRILGEVALGFYSVAYQLMIRPLSVLNPIFTRVALPLFVNIRNDDARLAAGYLDTVKIIALVSFPIYIAMALCAPAIIQIIMGEKWGEAAPILYFLSLLGLFFSIGNPIGTLILAKGKPKWAFQLNCFSLLIYAFAFWLGSQYSALAVAVAFLVAGVFVLFPVEFYLRHQLVGMTLVQYFSAMRHLFIAAAIPILLHAFFYLSDMSSSNIDSQLISAFFAVIFFFTYLLFKDRQLIVIAKNLVLKDHL